MTIPCIVIQRHAAGLYEWSIHYGDQKVDGDVGDSSITECLVGAVVSLSEAAAIMEIRYRGIHMGTFRIAELTEATEGVSERIAAAYGEFSRQP
jgi:hypothetical protein